MAVYKKPNTLVVIVLLCVNFVKVICESAYKGGIALFTGRVTPLRPSRFLSIWHWVFHHGPRKFWRFPTAIQIGRLPSTLLQIIFGPDQSKQSSRPNRDDPPSSRESGFTIIEVLISVTLTGAVLITAYSVFQGIAQSQILFTNATNNQAQAYYLSEKIATLIQSGGTLDYEEYFNRSILGYDRELNTEKFETPSEYGNTGTIYKCGEEPDSGISQCLGPNKVGLTHPYESDQITGNQPYGQYAALAWNHASSRGYPEPIPLPVIIPPGTDEYSKGLPELYLIKELPNGSYERTYLRHMNICDTSTPLNCRGKIQMTKMMVSSPGTGTPGDIVKTHPDFCDAPCGMSDLVWLDITPPSMDVVEARFLPAPLQIPRFMAGGGSQALSPTVDIRIVTQLSRDTLQRGLLSPEHNITSTLITTYSLDE